MASTSRLSVARPRPRKPNLICWKTLSDKRPPPKPATKKCNEQKTPQVTINFLGPETARWGGGLPRGGVVAENFVPALESLSSLGLEDRNLGCPGIFAGMSRTPWRCSKSLCKKTSCAFFVTLRTTAFNFTKNTTVIVILLRSR